MYVCIYISIKIEEISEKQQTQKLKPKLSEVSNRQQGKGHREATYPLEALATFLGERVIKCLPALGWRVIPDVTKSTDVKAS